MSDLGGLVTTAGASQRRTDSDPQEHASAGTAAALAPQQSDNAVTSPMKGTPVNRILSGAIKVAGSLALVGGAMAAAAAPAGAAPSPTNAYGISAFGSGFTINPVAYADIFNTPQVSGPVIVPGFVTTGGILDRAKRFQAYSQVGAVKVYGFSQVEQLNASMVSSTCRLGFNGDPLFGDATIQAGSIVAPDVRFFPPIPLIRNPAPNTVINLGPLTVTLNKQTVTAGQLTVTGIYVSGLGQNLSIAVSRCGVDDLT
jgi:hypothetical protein